MWRVWLAIFHVLRINMLSATGQSLESSGTERIEVVRCRVNNVSQKKINKKLHEFNLMTVKGRFVWTHVLFQWNVWVINLKLVKLYYVSSLFLIISLCPFCTDLFMLKMWIPITLKLHISENVHVKWKEYSKCVTYLFWILIIHETTYVNQIASVNINTH